MPGFTFAPFFQLLNGAVVEECFLIKEQCRDNMTQWQKDLSVCEATADRSFFCPVLIRGMQIC